MIDIERVNAANEWDIECEHEKLNSISPSIHVLFCLLYKHTNNDVFNNNNNNNNYSFWSASLRLGALTILNRNKKKNWWLFTKFLYSWSKLQNNYNDERKKKNVVVTYRKDKFLDELWIDW